MFRGFGIGVRLSLPGQATTSIKEVYRIVPVEEAQRGMSPNHFAHHGASADLIARLEAQRAYPDSHVLNSRRVSPILALWGQTVERFTR